MKAFFLEVYGNGSSIRATCKALSIPSTRYVREWRKEDPEFAAAFATAEMDRVDALEDEARRRAYDGIPEPVYQAGKRVMDYDSEGKGTPAVVRKYSDLLLIFLLKAAAPEKYRENRYPLTAGMELPLGPDTITIEQREAIRRVIIGRSDDGGGSPRLS